MLREEQIDIRRQRAAQANLQIKKVGKKNQVFSDYEVSNPQTGGKYAVTIRGFDVGDNECSCPDFKTNTLGTCKHIEAVLASLQSEAQPQLRKRKATFTHPEVYLHYGEELRVGLHLPPRNSPPLMTLAETFFDPKNLWKGGDRYENLIEAVHKVPEQVKVTPEAMEFMNREIDRRELARREPDLRAYYEEYGHLEYDLLSVPLYPYQMEGAIFLACRGRCILGDDMGLGKTAQTMAAVEILAHERNIERVLVVAPASVKYQWESEIKKFTSRPVQVIDGLTPERKRLYAQPTFYRLVNYETVLRDLEALNAWQPDLIVLDEAQRIKNWEAKTSRAVKKLRSKYAFVLTGTPLENKIEELYSIVQFVDDRRLGPAFQFLYEHRVLDKEGKLLGYKNLDKVREKLAPILLRRTREEVLTQLPARTDNTVYVEMAEEQKKLYAENQVNLGKLAQKKYLSEIDRRRILAYITNMRMICDSTYLFDKQTNVSPKLAEFEEKLHELLHAGQHKVVVFSQWETMLQLAAEVVKRLGFGLAMLHGNVPTKDRRALMERFRDDPACRVFLSTDAGGVGLNLQVADTVINLEVPWNPAVLDQRNARVHRLGQHNPVQVFNLVTRDSIEERVLRALATKRNLFEGIFSGDAEELAVENVGNQAFLEAVRAVTEEPAPPPAPAAPSLPPGEAGQALMQAGVQLLEALANYLRAATPAQPAGGPPVLQIPLPPPETLQRGLSAVQSLLQGLQPTAPLSANGDGVKKS